MMTILNVPKSSEKIAIIGCGYVGKAMAKFWHKQGHSITGTTTRAENLSELEEITDQALIMRGDNGDSVQTVLQDQDTVLICVAPISDRQVNAEEYAQTYLPTVQNIVTALHQNQTVRQIIYISSCSVYGDQKGKLVDENTFLDQEGEHGKILIEAEAMLQEKPDIITLSILRLGGIYGPGRELDQRLGKLAGKTLPGTGKNWTNWIHLDDIMGAIEFVRQHRFSGTFNLVNDVQLTSQDLCNLICDRQQLERVIWDESKPPFSAVNARVNNHKIKALGYQFIYGDRLI